MANYWLHNGFLQVEGEKMSKSLGNFVTIRELLRTDRFGGKSWSGQVLRLAMLRTHYRQPIDWTVKSLDEAYKNWISLGNVVREHMNAGPPDSRFLAELADDLNTPAAFVRLFELRDEALQGDQESGRALTGSLRLLGFFDGYFPVKITITYPVKESGLTSDDLIDAVRNLSGDFDIRDIAKKLDSKLSQAARDFIAKFAPGTTVRDINSIFDGDISTSQLLTLDLQRLKARKAKDFKESDRIRDELARMRVVVRDGKDPKTGEPVTTWEIAR
jgi:cysteinyl-tRNA synthetase